MTRLFARLAPLFRPAAVAVIAASVLAAVFQHLFVPISPDGGWYSYPSFAWAMGGDPSENIPGAYLPVPADRLSAEFVWENRLNLAVPLTGLWFKIVPASFESLSLFGALQWIAVAGLVALVVRIATGDRLVAATAGLVALSDSRLIAEALSDARPDIPIAIAAVGLLAALVRVLKGPAPVAAALLLLLAVVLPLMHVTSANSIAMLLALIGMTLLFAWFYAPQQPFSPAALKLAFAAGVVMALVFLLRQPILDVLVPTAVPREIETAGQHSLFDKLKENFGFGPYLKFKMEWERWSHQFNPLNLAQLLFLVLAGAAALVAWRRRDISASALLGIAGMTSLLGAALFMIAVNPHHTPGHALVVTIVAYAAGGIALGYARQAGLVSREASLGIAAALLLTAAALKIVHAGGVYYFYPREGISNAAVAKALDDAVPRDRTVEVLGASELWPYLAHRRHKLRIIDPNRMFIPKGPNSGDWRRVERLIVNEDHFNWGWGDAIAAWQKQGILGPAIAMVGECGRTKRCVAVYEFFGNRLK